jgi:hypothetical protein
VPASSLVIYLTAYNARKKLRIPSPRELPGVDEGPLLGRDCWQASSSSCTCACACRPGPFEAVLAALFVAVTLSGIAGWWLSRALPERLTSAGGEVPYERIPAIRRALRERAEALVLAGIPAAGATTLADFYAARLGDFLKGPRNFLGRTSSARAGRSTRCSRTWGRSSAT